MRPAEARGATSGPCPGGRWKSGVGACCGAYAVGVAVVVDLEEELLRRRGVRDVAHQVRQLLAHLVRVRVRARFGVRVRARVRGKGRS